MSSEAAGNSPGPSADRDYSWVTYRRGSESYNNKSDSVLNMMAPFLNTMVRMEAKMDDYPQKVTEKLDSMDCLKKLEEKMDSIMQKEGRPVAPENA
jgi:hypothetical protein